MADDGLAIVDPDELENPYEGSDVPGEFRRLTEALGCESRRAPPASHRNEGSEPVEMWVVSRQIQRSDATKIDDFWDASPQAVQHRD